MAKIPDELLAQVKRLSERLDKRITQHKKIEPYLEGECPIPPAVTEARLTKVYRNLMPVSEAPWGSLIIDSKLDRLEVSGLGDQDDEAAKRVWAEVWQPNELDGESILAHGASLLDGRCFATVWPGENGAPPDIALDDCTQMIVEYADGSRRFRKAALRKWREGNRTFATLYRADGIFKFQGPANSADAPTSEWEQRTVDGEEWPLKNPFEEVNVVELAVNRRLKPGVFPYARGEFEHCTGLIDRIHLLTFLGLVIAFWLGFPLRGVSGEAIRRTVLKDDDGHPIIDEETGKEKTKAEPPIEVKPDSLFQLENPEAKLLEFKAADRRNLSIYDELQQLAVISKTPRHYFPMEGGIANIDTETVNAFEGAMHAAVKKHKGTLGTGWLAILRLGAKVLDRPVDLSPQARVGWMDHEFRSLAERADAVSKLAGVLPPLAIAEYALNVPQDVLARWMAMDAANPLMKLIADAKAGGATGNGTPSAVPAG